MIVETIQGEVREMNILGWKFESEILRKYGRVIRRLILIPPDWIERKLNGETAEHKVPPIVKVFFLLVIGLSLASISNIGIRAYHYHANIFSYITGACFALVVPASVYVAAHMKGLTPSGRRYTWAVAAFAALLSSFIQVKLYMTETDITLATWLSGNIDIEALSFSAGIPFFEVLIASLAAMISDAHERAMVEVEAKHAEQERITKLEADAEAKRLQADADERAGREHKRQLDRLRADAELEAYRAKLAQDAELEREKALAELRIKEQKALAKTAAKLSENDAKKVSTTGKKPENNQSESIQKVSPESVGRQLVLYYKANPGALLEEAAQHVGWSVPAVSKEVSSLVDIGVFHAEKQGRRKVITVNGNHEQFLAGRI